MYIFNLHSRGCQFPNQEFSLQGDRLTFYRKDHTPEITTTIASISTRISDPHQMLLINISTEVSIGEISSLFLSIVDARNGLSLMKFLIFKLRRLFKHFRGIPHFRDEPGSLFPDYSCLWPLSQGLTVVWYHL